MYLSVHVCRDPVWVRDNDTREHRVVGGSRRNKSRPRRLKKRFHGAASTYSIYNRTFCHGMGTMAYQWERMHF